tara:strand:- start:10 stop:819 length:810 start_codon:yes stop_codon:yes gene_type:complete
MIFLIIAVLIIFYLIFFWNWRKNEQYFYLGGRPIIIGHRGSPTKITENTKPSFEKALDQGVEGIELDIRLTKDKKIVVFHDDNLLRLSGVNIGVKDLAYTEMLTHTLKKEKNQKEGVVAPQLEDLLPVLNKSEVINIEIKSDSFFDSSEIVDYLISFLDNNNLDYKCIVSCFNPLMLWRLRRKRPQTIIGLLYTKRVPLHSTYNMMWAMACRADNLHIHYDFIDSWIVKWAKRKGMRVNSYTINNGAIYKKVIRAKADGIFTDNIEYIK